MSETIIDLLNTQTTQEIVKPQKTDALRQNWNNVLNYIKRNLGAKVNLIEMSDDEIVQGLKEDALGHFSQYCPHKKWTIITSANLIISDKPGQPRYIYRIKTPDNDYIVDIYQVYNIKDTAILDRMGGIVNYEILLDIVMANTYLDASRSLNIRNTWEFIPPDVIVFDTELNDSAVIEYNTPHKTLDTIPPDLYHSVFKPLCLGNVKLWLAALRSKYENLASPFGQLNINWQQLQQEGYQLIQEAEQKMQMVPPDVLATFEL